MKPEKTKSVSVILPISLIRRLEEAGRPEQRKIGAQIRKVLRDWESRAAAGRA